jgi:histidine triad (HIT) family protein
VANLAHDPRCVFCKIIAGEIPSARVLETELAVAFLDIQPLNPGHTLLVPRSHHALLSDLPEELAAHAGALLPRLCRVVRAATGSVGLNVIINIGQAAGQTIDHCHWHIIPRSAADSIHWPWPQGKYEGDELARMKARIENELASEPYSTEDRG